MNTRSFTRGVAAAAVFFLAVSPGNGRGPALSEGPAPQKGNQVVEKQAREIPPIPPQQKQKILQMKHVKHDPSAQARSYGFLHPIDRLGWLELDQANVYWAQKNADINTNTGSVIFTFVPIAANKPHLVIFSVSVADGPVTVQIHLPDASGMMQNTMTETVTIPNGPSSNAYVPVFFTPLHPTAYCVIAISNSSTNYKTFLFQRVTMELVK